MVLVLVLVLVELRVLVRVLGLLLVVGLSLPGRERTGHPPRPPATISLAGWI